MAKKISDTSSESSLSPPPEGLSALAEKATVQTTAKGTKRKAEAIVTKTTKRTKKTAVEDGTKEAAIASTNEVPRAKRGATTKVKYEETVEEEEKANGVVTKAATVKKTARTVKKKNVKDAPPLEERTKDSKLRVGAHVSTAGGVQNAIPNLIHIGGNAFAMFMKNQRKWDNPAMDPEAATTFINACELHHVEVGDCCLPHGSYLVNLAHPDPERKKQAYDAFHDDLVRCHKLGIKLYNFHPGNANATTREEGIKLIAENLNQAHSDPATGEVITVLETMASLGNTIGGTFEDIAAIIEHVTDKSRVAVCLDTCHVFAAGYDLRTPDAYAETMAKFDKIIDLKYLKALHINDSKAPLSSHRDLHARIGTGYLGLRAFHNIVNDERLHVLPMILETPNDVVGEDGKKFEDKSIWAREIKMLEKLVGMDVESQEFKDLEAKLHEEGTSERERVGDQVDRKQAKDTKPKKQAKEAKPKKQAKETKPKKTGKGKKKVESEDEDDDDEE
ncbi:AP endonuclease [Dothidotthia symphoricarpi CBS 119687]|uniref:Apurinic-apyrimidinic endonuclease 1 n=1 Tax=Dothidotthia symphoricarpi CBS 119687 TaxID=1392245 RepID=A0A6A6ARI4_9PLEO|nr:AP endonuclease [Dothidotthia symphoricarpi CBS 119687]KAF2134592.1 AP endonuclease [Dothidotthia symphoricarpi CBS 119687]